RSIPPRCTLAPTNSPGNDGLICRSVPALSYNDEPTNNQKSDARPGNGKRLSQRWAILISRVRLTKDSGMYHYSLFGDACVPDRASQEERFIERVAKCPLVENHGVRLAVVAGRFPAGQSLTDDLGHFFVRESV